MPVVAKSLGISRTPVREAFLHLEKEGLIKILPKKGAVTSLLTPSRFLAWYCDGFNPLNLFCAQRKVLACVLGVRNLWNLMKIRRQFQQGVLKRVRFGQQLVLFSQRVLLGIGGTGLSLSQKFKSKRHLNNSWTART